MKTSELKQIIREEIKSILNESDVEIVAIFPGESEKYPYMFYFKKPDGSIWYVAGVGKTPKFIAKTEKEFKKLVKDRIRAKLVTGAKPAFNLKIEENIMKKSELNRPSEKKSVLIEYDKAKTFGVLGFDHSNREHLLYSSDSKVDAISFAKKFKDTKNLYYLIEVWKKEKNGTFGENSRNCVYSRDL